MNGDAWRWQIEYHGWRPLRTIQVIEPPARRADAPAPPAGRRVPFGFARVLAPAPEPELDPLTWDGDDG